VKAEFNPLFSEEKIVNYRIGSLLCLLAWGLPAQDTREKFEANAYFGVSVDSFAAGELNRYINPDQAGKVRERAIGGVSFAFRLLGDPKTEGEPQDKLPSPWIKRTKLFVFGETLHGARSAGVDCTADQPATETSSAGYCVQFDPSKPNRTLALIRNSTSLEAFTGLRWELKQMTQSALYVKGQVGFLTVAGVGGDVVDFHHLALGIISTAGNFKGSYLEAGIGKTDLFPTHRSPRLKIDGYLQFPLLGKWADAHGISGFAQMTVDSNWSRGGADSIQSYFGINFDLKGLF
jgi:hypothetical protein